MDRVTQTVQADRVQIQFETVWSRLPNSDFARRVLANDTPAAVKDSIRHRARIRVGYTQLQDNRAGRPHNNFTAVRHPSLRFAEGQRYEQEGRHTNNRSSHCEITTDHAVRRFAGAAEFVFSAPLRRCFVTILKSPLRSRNADSSSSRPVRPARY